MITDTVMRGLASRRAEGLDPMGPPLRSSGRRLLHLAGLLLEASWPVVPLDRGAQPVLERCAGDEVEGFARAGRVEGATWLAVRPGRVPPDLAPEAGQANHE